MRGNFSGRSMPSGKVGVGGGGGGGNKLSAVQRASRATRARASIKTALLFIDIGEDDLEAMPEGAHQKIARGRAFGGAQRGIHVIVIFEVQLQDAAVGRAPDGLPSTRQACRR